MPQRPVSAYEMKRDMKLFARLFEDMMCERWDDRRGEAPRERSQFPIMDCITIMGK